MDHRDPPTGLSGAFGAFTAKANLPIELIRGPRAVADPDELGSDSDPTGLRARSGPRRGGRRWRRVTVTAAVRQVVAEVRARGTHSLAVTEHAPAGTTRRR
eukprot:scaffold14419_cov60-Phaeocystis_antarctica.AAC.2